MNKQVERLNKHDEGMNKWANDMNEWIFEMNEWTNGIWTNKQTRWIIQRMNLLFELNDETRWMYVRMNQIEVKEWSRAVLQFWNLNLR